MQRIPNVELNGWCKHKGHFYMNIKKNKSPLPNLTSLMVMQCCIEVVNIFGSQHPHMSSQHNKNMLLAHFDIFTRSNHLQIAHLMCLGVDIHVGLMFIVFWLQTNALGGLNVWNKSPSNRKWVLGKLGVKVPIKVFILAILHLLLYNLE